MPDVPWLVIAWPLLMLGVIVVAAVYKYIQVNNAKSWRSAPGVVIRSDVETRNVKVMSSIQRADGGGTEARNFANVVYEYELFGKKLRNNRVSIGEDLGNFEVEETLARYPVGTRVIVYYNPRNPKEAVLERDMPKGMWGCLTIGVLGSTVAYLFAVFGFGKVYDALSGIWSPANAGRVMFFTGFGLISAMIVEAIRRNVMLARSWPVVRGRIEKSEVEQFQGFSEGRNGSRGTIRTFYKSVILYSYTVNSRAYTGTNLGLNSTVTASFEGPARRAAERFKVGEAVDVHYNPKNPSEAALDPRVPIWFWLLWLIPLSAFAAAIFFARA
jgi:hypothetical protein